MLKKTVSSIMLMLLLASMLPLMFKFQPAKASEGSVKVTPEHPGTSDLVKVRVSYTFSTWPPTVMEFGPLERIGNTFSVNVTVLYPEFDEYVCQVVHTDEYVYSLGYLSAGQYKFEVYSNSTFFGDQVYWFLDAAEPFEVYDIRVPDDYSTIQDAVNAASDGDTILVRSGIYFGPKDHLAFDAIVVVNKSISLIGENKSNTILDGSENGFDRIIHITADDVVITGFTIQNVGSIWCDCGGAIFISESNGNKIFDNILKNPYATGINLWSTNNTQITENIFLNNGNAIYCKPYSNNNIIYHNNFVNSVSHININRASNIWDDGYPSGGNYWNDYNGTDFYSGIFQNETGSDGIGDTPYAYDENNTDRYPLIRPWKWPLLGEINHDFKVDIRDVAAAALAFGSYPKDPNWNPLADVTGPEYLVPDNKVDIRDIALIASNFGEMYP